MAEQTLKVNPLFVKLIIGILALLLGFMSVIFVAAGWAIWNNTGNISVLSSKSASDQAQWRKMRGIVAEAKDSNEKLRIRLRAVEVEQAYAKGYRDGQKIK